MKRHAIKLLCFIAALLCLTSSALAADTGARSTQLYPISVEEYTEGNFDELRIRKIYQLSLSDDPAGIPTEDFERNGHVFHLLDLIRKDEIGVDTQPHTETVTMDSSTGELSAVLKQLDAQKEFTTEDGYSGVLLLDHTSVKVEVKGYTTKTSNLSATRTYPNLSDADLSLVPKTVQDGGKTLTLANVNWSSAHQTEGEEVVTRYTATATYTGSSSSKAATGYKVTANYTGELSKTGCEVVTYTAIFGGEELPRTQEAARESGGISAVGSAAGPVGGSALSSAALLICGGGVAALAAVLIWRNGKFQRKKGQSESAQ